MFHDATLKCSCQATAICTQTTLSKDIAESPVTRKRMYWFCWNYNLYLILNHSFCVPVPVYKCASVWTNILDKKYIKCPCTKTYIWCHRGLCFMISRHGKFTYHIISQSEPVCLTTIYKHNLSLVRTPMRITSVCCHSTTNRNSRVGYHNESTRSGESATNCRQIDKYRRVTTSHREGHLQLHNESLRAIICVVLSPRN